MSFRILLAGDTGSGKTTQLLTMPRPWYVHIFDPSALNSLDLLPEEFTMFAPEKGDLEMTPRLGLKQGTKRPALGNGPQVYMRWVETFNRESAAGRFDQLGTFMLDSATMLGMHLMERQRWMGDKQGREDERQDHKLAGETMINALWNIFSLPCNVIVTMHTKYAEVKVGDTKTGELRNKLTVPGSSQLVLPRFTSACLYTSLVEDSKTKAARYVALTRPQARWPHVRTPRSWGQLDLYHDMTIRDWEHPERYGLGALIAKAGESGCA